MNKITPLQLIIIAAIVAFFSLITSGPLGSYLWTIAALVALSALILFVINRRH